MKKFVEYSRQASKITALSRVYKFCQQCYNVHCLKHYGLTSAGLKTWQQHFVISRFLLYNFELLMSTTNYPFETNRHTLIISDGFKKSLGSLLTFINFRQIISLDYAKRDNGGVVGDVSIF